MRLSLSTSTPHSELHTRPLHDALPICTASASATTSPALRSTATASAAPTPRSTRAVRRGRSPATPSPGPRTTGRSEEHTSELQSRGHLVCRLLLEKKKHIKYNKQVRTK